MVKPVAHATCTSEAVQDIRTQLQLLDVSRSGRVANDIGGIIYSYG